MSKSEGLGFLEVLQIVFIILKLCKVITWPWLLVLVPTFINLAVAGILILIAIFW